MDCTRWPGHPMASTLLQRREAVLITMQKIRCAYGMLRAGILSISIAVILIMCLPWRGRLMGSKSHPLRRITRCRCGERDECGWQGICSQYYRGTIVKLAFCFTYDML